MKNFVSLFSISLFLLILWQCNPMFERKEEKAVPVSTIKRDLENEKENIARNLRDCSNDLDRRIRALDDRVKTTEKKADENVTRSLNELRTRLVREKKKVDNSLRDIQQSTNATWQKINKKANQILTDAKIETQKTEERVEDLIDQLN
ncbi:MAG TPA: hypothetical protein VF473_03105 [Cyclobacteriaceae bacterium]